MQPLKEYIFQVSSSMKICYCGGTLSLKKSNSIGNNKKSSKDGVTIRRTERIKRGKPDYYDPLEYERQQKKVDFFSFPDFDYRKTKNFNVDNCFRRGRKELAVAELYFPPNLIMAKVQKIWNQHTHPTECT